MQETTSNVAMIKYTEIAVKGCRDKIATCVVIVKVNNSICINF